jgi:hypothetical protein
MGYGQRWPERKPRPKAQSLSNEDKTKLLATMTKEIASSPVLSGLGVQARLQRGRFYLEKLCDEDDSAEIEEFGRITPLAGPDAGLLLEVERRKGSWSEIARGSAQTLIRAVASDSEGTFHGLGSLDKALRQSGNGLERVTVEPRGTSQFVFVYAETGVECSVQEALFHYFGIPLMVIAEPSEWYSYHRKPKIAEANQDRSRVLVRFSAESFDGTVFGGTCLYAFQDGKWDADVIKPSESRDIVTAEAWLVKRKGRAGVQW